MSADATIDTPAGSTELRLRGIAKSFGAVAALADANLTARAGEVHALIGENGAGKSTLLRVLAGLVRQDTGTIDYLGAPLRLTGPRSANAAGIRVVFQELSLLPDLTVAQNLVIGDEPVGVLGTVRRGVRERARGILEDLEVDGIDVTARVSEIPSAWRQKIEIAKALWRMPSILILDEPTSMLSHADSEWLLRHARTAAERGAVVLFISHRIAEIRAVADRFTVLRSGRDVARGLVGEHTDGDLVEAMLGRRLEQLYSAPTTTPGAPALRIEGLEAGGLRDFSAVLRRGEILGVAALEGQGQRELFMALAGAQSFKGTVVLEGERYAPRTPRGAIDLGVALVPEDRQSEGLLGPMTVQENITVSRLDRLRNRLRMIDSSRELEAAIKGVARLNLPKARLEDRVGVLSGGNQQKTIFARGLLSEPRVLLLYDCTRGVDVGTKAEIFSLMQQLAAEDVAILFYSSDLAELVHMTHQTIVLAGHRVAAALEGPALTEERLLRGMMFDRETPTAVAS